jgi:hypothetical protein
MPTLKGDGTSGSGDIKVGAAKDEEPETEEEKKKRERFERLAKLN